MRIRCLPVAALALAAALPNAVRPAAARAQAAPGDTGTSASPVPPWERRSAARPFVGGAGLYQAARGASGARVQDGGGFDAFVGVHVSSLALAAGYQRSSHGLPGAGTGRVTDQGLFVEPRVSVAPFRNFSPYLAARLSFVRRSVPAGAQFAGETRSLVGYGAGVGTLVWLAPGVQLDAAALYTGLSGGDQAASAVVPAAFRGGTGSAPALRLGVVVGLDRWGR